MTAWLDRIAAEVAARRPAVIGRPLVIALAGGVASGKSTIAGMLADRLAADGLSVEIVPADGFLMPNAVLSDRGLMDRKGFPDSYDWPRLEAYLAEVPSGRRHLGAPTYSHAAYDVGPDRAFDRPDVLIFEGLIALQPAVAPIDLGLYVEAAEEDLIAWYVARFMALDRWKAPRLADRLAAVGGEPQALARDIWDRINSPNLRDHVEPTRARADLILAKASDHSVRLIAG